MRYLISAVLSGVLLFVAEPAFANFKNCGKTVDALAEFRSGKNYAELARDYGNQCAASSELLADARLHIEGIQRAKPEAKKDATRLALTAMLAIVDSLPQRYETVDRAAVETLKTALECDIQTLGDSVDADACPDDRLSVAGTLAVDKWRPGGQLGSAWTFAFMDLFGPPVSQCLTESVATMSECDGQFTSRFLPVVDVFSVMHNHIVPASNSFVSEQIVTGYGEYHERWKNYLADTGLQYPWELTINKKRNGGFKEIAQRQEPPTSRLVVLHPTIGLSHSSDAPDGDQVNVVGIVKLIGYKSWRYSSTKPKDIWGVSVISTFADIPDVDDSGIGLMLEYNNLSVGYSWHGSDGVVTLNIDLAKVLADRPDSIEGWLEKLE